MRSRLGRNVMLGIGGAVAALAVTVSRGEHSSVENNVGTATLAAPAAAASAATVETKISDIMLPPSRRIVADPDATLLLEQMQQRGDRYTAPMSDGRTAVLSIDPRLQAAAEWVLDLSKAPRGAIVVTDPQGRVLALAGRRTLDPKGGKEGIVDHSLALQAWAPAASIFKVVSAAAMVEHGARGNDRVCFHGGVRSVMESNLVDSKQDRRCDDLSYGLAYSQNAIIAKVAHKRLEPADLVATAGRFGFGIGAPRPLAFPAPAVFGAATIPTEKGVPFGRTAAGFEGVTLSPLGGAMLAGAIAHGGTVTTPTIVTAYIVDGVETPVSATSAAHQVVDAKVAAEVAAMMTETCKKGSAARAFTGREKIRDVAVAGKTGTLSETQPHYTQYSWFVGYAPADQPTLTISVLLGNAELWYLKAHTAARTVLAEGLRPRPPS
jgi:cell division protein FtsI/penicillin-binding protein 2